MLRLIQSGEYINTVYNFANKFIIKKYFDPKKAERDLIGAKIWKKYAKHVTTIPFLKFKEITIMNYVNFPKNYTQTDKKSIVKDLAFVYKKLVSTYSYHKEVDNTHYQNWKLYLENIFDLFEIYKNDFEKNLPKKIFLSILNTVYYLKNIDWGNYQKIPLHRDLNWENVLKVEKGIKIIDFEHFCVGPIEFEFSNSIFWNDYASINFDEFCNECEKLGLIINKPLAYQLTLLYFIEQYHIAYSSKNTIKINLLIKLLKTFYSQYKECVSKNPHITSTYEVIKLRDQLLLSHTQTKYVDL